MFRRDLYRGTAGYYDRFRVPYPAGLIGDLAGRAGADGTGGLLGSGLRDRAAQLRVAGPVRRGPGRRSGTGDGRHGRGQGRGGRAANVRALACAAEDLRVPAGSFDLVTIGNAFHRLPRDTVAASTFRWLRPGGFLALAWGGSPNEAEERLAAGPGRVTGRWKARAGAHGRVPAEYEQDRRERPDLAILRGAGFENAGRHQFAAVHDWTPEALAGYALSTSVLSPVALGGQATEFTEDLRRELAAAQPDGRFQQTIIFACDLARRPAAGAAG